MLVVYFFFEF